MDCGAGGARSGLLNQPDLLLHLEAFDRQSDDLLQSLARSLEGLLAIDSRHPPAGLSVDRLRASLHNLFGVLFDVERTRGKIDEWFAMVDDARIAKAAQVLACVLRKIEFLSASADAFGPLPGAASVDSRMLEGLSRRLAQIEGLPQTAAARLGGSVRPRRPSTAPPSDHDTGGHRASARSQSFHPGSAPGVAADGLVDRLSTGSSSTPRPRVAPSITEEPPLRAIRPRSMLEATRRRLISTSRKVLESGGRTGGVATVASRWAGLASEDFVHDLERLSWTGIPQVHLNHNYLITGDRNTYWVDWMRDRFFPDGDAGDTLSLGCGAGHLDRIFKGGISRFGPSPASTSVEKRLSGRRRWPSRSPSRRRSATPPPI